MISAYDLQQSVSKLVRDYEYTSVVVLTMSMGLAVALFLFTQIYAIKYKTLPFPESDKIVLVSRSTNGIDRIVGGMFDYDVHYFTRRQTSFDDFGAFENRSFTLSTEDFTEQVRGVATSSNMFSLVGEKAFLGRTLEKTDDQLNGQPVTVLSYEVWDKYFNRNTNVVGTNVIIDGQNIEVVGVMPEGFQFPYNHKMWVSYLPPSEAAPKGGGWHSFYGRLKPGVSLQQARDEMVSFADELKYDYPKIYKGKTVAVKSFTEPFGMFLRLPTLIMEIVSIAILCMSCFSIANLLFVRTMENSKETLIKTALGVPVLRVIANLLLESFWLCLFAGALGLGVCYLAIQAVGVYVVQGDGPFWWSLAFEQNLAVIGVVYVLLTWLITGIFPALMSLRTPTNALLSGGSKGGNTTRSGSVMNTFISLQVLCVFVLMVFTGLSLSALIKILNADYGVETKGYLTASVKLPGSSYPNLEDRVEYYERLQNQVSALPGVDQVAFAGGLPGGDSYLVTYSSVDDKLLDQDGFPKAIELPISENHFEVFGSEFIEGQGFSPALDLSAELVAIINIDMAKQLWPNSNAVGKQFHLNPDKDDGPLVTVVGVVGNIIYGSPISFVEDRYNLIYLPMKQVMHGWASMNVVVKAEGNPYAISQEVKATARNVDPQVALHRLMSFEDRLALNGGYFQRMVYNFLPASILALIMAAIGIFGITKRIILQKTPDIGIMKALGTKDLVITKEYMLTQLKYLLFGIVPGTVFFILALPQISQNIALTSSATLFLIVVAVIFIVSLIVFLASYIPLRSVHKLSPRDAINFLN